MSSIYDMLTLRSLKGGFKALLYNQGFSTTTLPYKEPLCCIVLHRTFNESSRVTTEGFEI